MAVSILDRLRSLFGRDQACPAPAVPGVHDTEELRRVLWRERCRSDRNGHGFTLLVFGDRSGDPVRSLGRLVEVLQTRVRGTDEMGWLDARRLAVLLPETSYRGAETLAQDVEAAFVGEDTAPECSVCCYPTDAGKFADVFGEPHPATRPGRREPPDEPPAGGGTPPRRRRSEVPILPGEPQEVEALFSRAMPPWKRLVDVALAGGALLMLSPIFLLIAIGIKLDSRGPVIFRQKRAGRGGRPFDFYKFRSMVIDAEARKAELLDQNETEGPIFKMERDPRITRMGRLLRKTSLDELPQLWNVLRGDMSLVGPRPPTFDEVEQYDSWQRRRLEVDGGITGLWQVSGRSTIKWPEFVRLDLRYIESRSLWNDLKILTRTLPAVLSGKGAK